MKGAKLVIGGFLTIVLLLVLIITLLASAVEECGITGSNGGSSAGGASGGVPEGQYSLPEANALDHITSGWRSSGRPDHRGIDIAQGQGTPLYAFADGVVAKSGPASGFGNWIVLDHEIDGRLISTVYGHIFDDGLHVSAGDQVKAGQHIADEGYNGQVSPPGPGGSHLHWEVWDGGRDGGRDVDPMPWLEQAVEPGTGAAEGDRDDSTDVRADESTDRQGQSTPDNDAPSRPAPRASTGGEMPTSDAFAEGNLQVNTIRVGRSVAQRFPQIDLIGGYRPDGKYPDHPSGQAVDIMIPSWDTGEGKQLGDDILSYLWENRDEFSVKYFIWRQEYIPAEGTPNIMDDRGDPTQNHMDHIHVTVYGGGYPSAGQTYGASPDGGSGAMPGGASGSANDGCANLGGVDAELAANADIPPEFIKWLTLAGQTCAAVNPALMAGLTYQESQFNPQAVNGESGAAGSAQFMPGTWAGAGAKVDDNGQVVGPPGSGSPHDIADATMASARYLCDMAEMTQGWVNDGRVSGDATELMLAAYNAGPGNVLKYGGVPPFNETQKYVVLIPQHAAGYAEKV